MTNMNQMMSDLIIELRKNKHDNPAELIAAWPFLWITPREREKMKAAMPHCLRYKKLMKESATAEMLKGQAFGL